MAHDDNLIGPPVRRITPETLAQALADASSGYEVDMPLAAQARLIFQALPADCGWPTPKETPHDDLHIDW